MCGHSWYPPESLEDLLTLTQGAVRGNLLVTEMPFMNFDPPQVPFPCFLSLYCKEHTLVTIVTINHQKEIWGQTCLHGPGLLSHLYVDSGVISPSLLNAQGVYERKWVGEN